MRGSRRPVARTNGPLASALPAVERRRRERTRRRDRRCTMSISAEGGSGGIAREVRTWLTSFPEFKTQQDVEALLSPSANGFRVIARGHREARVEAFAGSLLGVLLG